MADILQSCKQEYTNGHCYLRADLCSIKSSNDAGHILQLNMAALQEEDVEKEPTTFAGLQELAGTAKPKRPSHAQAGMLLGYLQLPSMPTSRQPVKGPTSMPQGALGRRK